MAPKTTPPDICRATLCGRSAVWDAAHSGLGSFPLNAARGHPSHRICPKVFLFDRNGVAGRVFVEGPGLESSGLVPGSRRPSTVGRRATDRAPGRRKLACRGDRRYSWLDRAET